MYLSREKLFPYFSKLEASQSSRDLKFPVASMLQAAIALGSSTFFFAYIYHGGELFISQYATHSVVHCHLAFYIASDIIFEFCGSKYENYLVSKFRLSSAHKKTPTTKIVQRDKMPE
jgi:hypothetical protein